MFKFWISIKSIPTENIKLENKTIHRTDTRNNTTILEKKKSGVRWNLDGLLIIKKNTANFYKYENVNKYKILSRIVINIYKCTCLYIKIWTSHIFVNKDI